MLDIAQQIAAAIICTEEPEPVQGEDHLVVVDADEIIGIIPPHLRHLFNLLQMLEQQLDVFFDPNVSEDYGAVVTVFHAALRDHVGVNEGIVGNLVVLPDWQVAWVGRNIKEEEQSLVRH